MNKNYPVIIACICKNEFPYLKEFVDYHLALGFDKIIIADNNDRDGERYESLLESYIATETVEILDYRGEKAAQLKFYNDIIVAGNYEWCAFIDADEFLTFSKKTEYKNIKDYLYSNKRIKAYKVNWMVFGDCGHTRKGEGNVVDRFIMPKKKNFRYHYMFPENAHVKSILHRDVRRFF